MKRNTLILILALFLNHAPAFAFKAVALDYQTGLIAIVHDVNAHQVQIEDPITHKKVWRERSRAPLAVDSHSGLKQHERVMFHLKKTAGGTEVQNADIDSELSYIFENGIARVAEPIRGDWNTDYIFHYIHLDHVIRSVKSLEGFQVNDRVCLRKEISTFPQGMCGEVVRIYENGQAELLMHSLFGLRKHLDTFDLIQPLSNLAKEPAAKAIQENTENSFSVQSAD